MLPASSSYPETAPRRGGRRLPPRRRRLLRVEIPDDKALLTDQVVSDLMGKDPSARFRFIMDRAHDAGDLDV